ncbi:hypothetical protein CTT31_08610 [Pseudoalteromonas maricaloris]|nr:hypothetical protein TW73_22485 [Pseudoalteromonas piscicida]USE69176.1 hypothetical protein CTT31_08610 [Pseudoalteromonas flavipulchra]
MYEQYGYKSLLYEICIRSNKNLVIARATEQTESNRGYDFLARGNYKLNDNSLTLKIGATDKTKLEKFNFITSDDPNYTFMGEWYTNKHNKTKVYAQYLPEEFYFAYSCDTRLGQ